MKNVAIKNRATARFVIAPVARLSLACLFPFFILVNPIAWVILLQFRAFNDYDMTKPVETLSWESVVWTPFFSTTAHSEFDFEHEEIFTTVSKYQTEFLLTDQLLLMYLIRN